MKNQKGVTLTSVAIYIVLILVVVGILATISVNFKSGIKNANMEGTEAAEINKFNVYFLEEVKKDGNDVELILNKLIQFKTGKTFLYDENKRNISIYDEEENKIEIAKNIETCTFEKIIENEKTIIKVTIKPENSEEKQLEYVLNNKLSEKVDESNYFSPYYTPLQFISFTGRKYIDTGIVAKTGLSAVARLRVPTSSQSCFLGNLSIDNYRFEMISFNTYNSSKVWGLGYYNQYNNLSNCTSSLTHDVEVAINNGEQYFKVDGNTIYTGNVVGNYTSDSNLYLFARKTPSGVDNYYTGAFFYCKIYDNGKLVRDFIPAKDSNEVVCIYDKVEGKFYYNQGIGNFTAGREL